MKPVELPRVPYDFAGGAPRRIPDEELDNRVRCVFMRDWAAYKKLAWLEDELRPVTGVPHRSFGRWAGRDGGGELAGLAGCWTCAPTFRGDAIGFIMGLMEAFRYER